VKYFFIAILSVSILFNVYYFMKERYYVPYEFGSALIFDNDLWYAVSHGRDYEFIKRIVDNDPDLIFSPGPYGLSVWMEIIKKNRPEVARLILEHGADPHERIFFFDANWTIPLNYALERERMSIAEVLIEFGANPEVMDKEGLTAFDVALMHDLKDVLKEWIDTYEKVHD